MFHPFNHDISSIALPDEFTWPFDYVPHPLCRIAADEVTDYITGDFTLKGEFAEGKMLGVMVVRDKSGRLGYLAAFSGNIAGKNKLPFFVPPIYDLLDPNGEFKKGEREIDRLTGKINLLNDNPELKTLQDVLHNAKTKATEAISNYRMKMDVAKNRRDEMRRLGADEKALISESQFMKGELRRLRKYHNEQISNAEKALDEYYNEVEKLVQERSERSEALQRRLFELYVVSNALGERRNLTDIFATSAKRRPPGGAGECCAPKLLEYAYRNDFRPICMAEFWFGNAPSGEMRHHGNFYPACHSKCRPILSFMLQGLNIEHHKSRSSIAAGKDIKIIYRDSHIIVVDKPAGMLSVPGKVPELSLVDRVREIIGNCEPLVVHRLDMDTSGVMVFALDSETQRALQHQFASRNVTKEYIAVLQGIINDNFGEISLPVRPDIDDRPRQIVDAVNGKQAITRYQVISRDNDKNLSRVKFHPLTGRTHQLRVHSAHAQGLGCPIMGDKLYGSSSNNLNANGTDRLHLHASSLTITHPATGKPMTFTSEPEF